MFSLRFPPDVAPAIEFASITGFGIGEVRALMWSQVDGDAGVIRLEGAQSRNAEGRTWPFGVHPRLGALLYEQIERTEEFQRRHGKIVPWVVGVMACSLAISGSTGAGPARLPAVQVGVFTTCGAEPFGTYCDRE